MALRQSRRVLAAIAGGALGAVVASSAPALAAPALATPALATPASVAAGEKLAFARDKGNCLTCHVIKGGDAPGNVGPPLVDMKQRFPNRKKLFAIIYDETRRNPQTVMPPFGRNLILTKQEINDIIDFLYTR
jgi:sulfur-oxidizing protein SoxX